MKSILSIIAGLFGVFVGLGFILPAVAKLRSLEALPTAVLLLIGVLLAAGSVGAALCGIRRPGTSVRPR
jgi:hypothetical protein